jgi:hypothetical protein
MGLETIKKLIMELIGKLEFISLFHPINLTKKDGTVIDLREHFFKVFENLNGINSSMNQTMNSIEIIADASSPSQVKFKNDGESLLILIKSETGMSNISAYLPAMLQKLNGREVILIETETSIKICNTPHEWVFELEYTHGNSCKIPEGQWDTVCQIGTHNTCIFVTAGPNGIMCEKFNTPMARTLLNRHHEGTMNATRIGDCAVTGRKEKK